MGRRGNFLRMLVWDGFLCILNRENERGGEQPLENDQLKKGWERVRDKTKSEGEGQPEIGSIPRSQEMGGLQQGRSGLWKSYQPGNPDGLIPVRTLRIVLMSANVTLRKAIF